MRLTRPVVAFACTLAAMLALPAVALGAARDLPRAGTDLALGTIGGTTDNPNDFAAGFHVGADRKLDVIVRFVKSACPGGQVVRVASGSGTIRRDGTFTLRVTVSPVTGDAPGRVTLRGRFVRRLAMRTTVSATIPRQAGTCRVAAFTTRGYAQGKGLDGRLRPNSRYVGLFSQRSGVLPSVRQPFMFRTNAAGDAITPFVTPALNVDCPSGSTDANPLFINQARIDIAPDRSFSRTGATVFRGGQSGRVVAVTQTDGRFPTAANRGVRGTYRIDATRQDASGATIERCTTGRLTFRAVRVGARLPAGPRPRPRPQFTG